MSVCESDWDINCCPCLNLSNYWCHLYDDCIVNHRDSCPHAAALKAVVEDERLVLYALNAEQIERVSDAMLAMYGAGWRTIFNPDKDGE